MQKDFKEFHNIMLRFLNLRKIFFYSFERSRKHNVACAQALFAINMNISRTLRK